MPLPSLPELLIGGLAVWRVSALIAYERGPFAIFTRIRIAAGINHFDDGTPITDGPTVRGIHGEFAKLFMCVWCLSPWIGLVWFGSFALWPAVTMVASSVLALSSLAILVERVNHG